MQRRALFFTSSRFYGGDDTVMLELLSAWRSGDSLTLAVNEDHPGLPVYEEKLAGKAKILRLSSSLSATSILRPLETLRAILELRALIARSGASAVLLSTGGFPLSPLSWRFLAAARLAGVERVVMAVHNYPTFPRSAAGRAYRVAMGKLAGQLAHRVVTVSEDCAKSLRDLVPAERLEIIPNGCSAPTSSRAIPKKPDERIIGAIGNIEKRKGFAHLVAALPAVLKEIPQARLVIIGACVEPEEERALRETASHLGVAQRVTLAGYKKEAALYVGSFDVCAAPSVARESFGLIALDAMRFRKPLVASAIGGLAEIVEEGVTGRLVAPGDEDALARALIELLKSPEVAARLGEAAHKRWKERYGAHTMAERYRMLLSK